MWHLLTLQEARGFITSYTVYYQQTTDSSSWQGQRQQGIKHAVSVTIIAMVGFHGISSASNDN